MCCSLLTGRPPIATSSKARHRDRDKGKDKDSAERVAAGAAVHHMQRVFKVLGTPRVMGWSAAWTSLPFADTLGSLVITESSGSAGADTDVCKKVGQGQDVRERVAKSLVGLVPGRLDAVLGLSAGSAKFPDGTVDASHPFLALMAAALPLVPDARQSATQLLQCALFASQSEQEDRRVALRAVLAAKTMLRTRRNKNKIKNKSKGDGDDDDDDGEGEGEGEGEEVGEGGEKEVGDVDGSQDKVDADVETHLDEICDVCMGPPVHMVYSLAAAPSPRDQEAGIRLALAGEKGNEYEAYDPFEN